MRRTTVPYLVVYDDGDIIRRGEALQWNEVIGDKTWTAVEGDEWGTGASGEVTVDSIPGLISLAVDGEGYSIFVAGGHADNAENGYMKGGNGRMSKYWDGSTVRDTYLRLSGSKATLGWTVI